MAPGLYVAHSLLLLNWVVDDAGISYAYAKNLAAGNGWVPQPGHEVVEGYSNPLWIFLLVPFFVLNLFDPVYTPKILALLLIIGLFYGIYRLISVSKLPKPAAGMAVLLLALNAPVVIWANSGLENALTLFLVVWLLIFSIQYAENASRKNSLLLWFFLPLMAINRAEGLFWSAIPVIFLLILSKEKRILKTGIVFCGIGITAALITLFRYLIFQDVLPNTFRAKTVQNPLDGPFSLSELIDKFQYLSYSVGGNWAKYMMVLAVLMFVAIMPLRKNNMMKGFFAVWILSVIHFMLMPDDWMGELRFAGVHIFAFYLFFSAAIWMISPGKLKVPILIFVPVFVLYGGYHFVKRTHTFAENPTVPLSQIRQRYADPFTDYSKRLLITGPSVFLPDVGAMYFYSDLKIYDAAGLCNRFVAKNRRYPDKIRSYVLQNIQPDWVHLHGRWSLQTALCNHPEFREMYRPVFEYKDSLEITGKVVFFLSGDYIHRRWADSTRTHELEKIKTERKNTFTF